MGEAPAAPRVFLVDGTAQLFRAYFAIRGLTGPDGSATNAVFGFTAMLRKLLKEEKPDYLGVAFDLAGPTFRSERFSDYKAHRPPMPEDLVSQMPLAKEVCRVHQVPVLEVDGYEADDVIATFTRLAREAGFDVTVVASDKDLLQLVREGVWVLNPTKNLRLDPGGVAESFGVAPGLVVDVLGLMGDAVDNIPGVPGVGEKTALAMVRTYGPLERVVSRAARLAAFFESRDRLLRLLDEGSGSGNAEARAELAEAGTAFIASLRALREEEADPAWIARLDPLIERVELFGRHLAGSAGGDKEGAKLARELKKVLTEIERGSSRKAWAAVHEQSAMATLSRELATLHCDVPLPFDPDALRVRAPDPAAAAALFRGLGFRTLAAEASAALPADAKPEEAEGEIAEEVDTPEALTRLSAALGATSRIALSIRTTGADPLRDSIRGIAIACEGAAAFHLPVDAGPLQASGAVDVAELYSRIAPVLEDPAIEKVGHDVKRLIHLLRGQGLPTDGWTLDTRLASFLLDPGRAAYRVDRLAEEILGRRSASSPEPGGSGDDSGGDDAGTVRTILALARALRGRLDEEGLAPLYAEVEGPLLPVLARMEQAGIGVDLAILGPMSAAMEETLARSRERIRELAGVPLNPDSPKQLREVLFGTLGLSSKRKTRKSGVESTDADTLEQLAEEHEIAREILRYREIAKLKGTYVDALPALIHPSTGRIHTTFDPAGAATGRLSSSNPNLQNIPVRTESGRKIRSAFVPGPGQLFVAADYSQVELRVLAHLCGDPELIAAFRAGEDVHRRTASGIFGIPADLVTDEMRQRAKAVNFGVLYGMSETRLAREQRIPRADARRFIEAYFERFRAVADYIERIRAEAMQTGEVRTLFGRRRRFPALRGRAGRAEAEQALRAAVNTTIQGTAADLMKMAMIRVDRALTASGATARMLLQVHDELLVEAESASAPEVLALVRAEMEGVFPLTVPLVVDGKIGRNWSEVA